MDGGSVRTAAARPPVLVRKSVEMLDRVAEDLGFVLDTGGYFGVGRLARLERCHRGLQFGRHLALFSL